MCSSRPFTIPSATEDVREEGTSGVARPTAFVPFVDMANHDDCDPNCEVQGRGDGAAYGAVGLVATRDLEQGEEALLSYFSAYPNAFTFSKFGFISSPNRHDRCFPPADLPPLSGSALKQTLSANSGRCGIHRPRRPSAMLIGRW
jgi:hypothetical protein